MAVAANGRALGAKSGTPRSTVTRPSASTRALTGSADAVHGYAAVDTGASVHLQVVRDAAGAIAALLDFATVGVEDPVVSRGTRQP